MRITLALFVVLTMAAACRAIPIVFTHEGRGTGQIGNTAFNDIPFKIVARGDTANRVQRSATAYSIAHDSALIELGNIGTLTYITPTRTFSQTLNGGIVGFSLAIDEFSDLISGPFNPTFVTWDMTSSIGPISGAAPFHARPATAITSGGTLQIQFTPAFDTATFTARVVPEPSAAALVIMVTSLLAWRVRH